MSTTTAGPAAARKRRRGDVQGSGRLAATLLSPTFIVLALVVGYPVIAALRESLYQRDQGLDANGFVVQGDKFVGLKNYTDIFTGPRLPRVLERLRQHHVLHRRHGRHRDRPRRGDGPRHAPGVHAAAGPVRAGILVPWAIPTVVSGLLWRWIFQADGIANAIIGRQVLWTTEGFHAKVAVIIADTWKTAPFVGLLVLAGLQVIPREVYEAARVDGAGALADSSGGSRCRWSSRCCCRRAVPPARRAADVRPAVVLVGRTRTRSRR